MVYMVTRFLLCSNTAQRAIHLGQNWVFKSKMSCMNLHVTVNIDHGVLEKVCCPHHYL